MNNDVIRLLPDSVANQIAAGEVIQRPASVIKELVENAVDAGATEISIILKDAGRTLIQVVDNGCGMSGTDARMAFERHATSKISAATDLYSLHTMGFRGEALPSIAAVAQIDMRTMRSGDSIGTRLQLSESRFEGQEPAACVPGTNIMVKNLFFHMPARRKFLKKDNIELSHILREFERLALVNTNIAFTLIHNDTTLHQFRAGNLKQRIIDLFGKNMESQLASVHTDTSLVHIDGFIGMPRYAKKRGAQQFLFVNGRNMRHPGFHKAIMRCYEHLVSVDSQPSYFIAFEVDPATIDVNIHPQKHEIKFEHEQAIWQILEAAVRETLGKSQAAGALDFDADEMPEIPLFDPHAESHLPDDGFDATYNPFKGDNEVPRTSSSGMTWRPAATHVPQDWDKLYEDFNRKREDAFDDEIVLRPAASENAPDTAATPCFQLRGGYIVTSSQRGIMVLSQRRAHTRILYDRFLSAASAGAIASQSLLFAEDFELPASHSAVLEGLTERLTKLGFRLIRTGTTTWSVSAVPAQLSGVSAVEVIMSMLEEVPETATGDALVRPLAMAMARSAAIGADQILGKEEMEALVADLFRCSEPSYTPDGQVIVTIFNHDEIGRRFYSET